MIRTFDRWNPLTSDTRTQFSRHDPPYFIHFVRYGIPCPKVENACHSEDCQFPRWCLFRIVPAFDVGDRVSSIPSVGIPISDSFKSSMIDRHIG